MKSKTTLILALFIGAFTLIPTLTHAGFTSKIEPISIVSIDTETVNPDDTTQFGEFHSPSNVLVDQNFLSYINGGSPGPHRFTSNKSLGILASGEKWHWSDWVLIRGIEGELILLDDGCNSTVQVMTENSDGSFTTVNYGGGPC